MKIIVQNRATEYEDDGTGKVLLLLHGWGDTLRTFDALAPLLSSAHRVVRLDLPGFGKTETPREAWNLDDYVRFVADFVRKRNFQVDTLVGHSFGGRIAIKAVSTHSLKPRRMILINSAGVESRRAARNFVLKVLTKVGGLITYIPPLVFWRETIRRRMYQAIGSDYVEAGALKKTFRNIVAEDLTASARSAVAPTLLIWGAQDTETPLFLGERLSALIRHSELKVIQGAGHFVHREKPEEVARFIQEFL